MSAGSAVQTHPGAEAVSLPDETAVVVGDAAVVAEDTQADPLRSAWGQNRLSWLRAIAYGLLPAVAVIAVVAAAFLKWQNGSVNVAQTSGAQSLQVAVEGTVALLSYQPDTVEADLAAARGRLTGTFLDSYTSLTRDVVIPGSKQRQIAAEAKVPAAASVSATGNHAVALLFVNQTVTVRDDTPTSTASSVRITLDRVGGRWLISGFDPV